MKELYYEDVHETDFIRRIEANIRYHTKSRKKQDMLYYNSEEEKAL